MSIFNQEKPTLPVPKYEYITSSEKVGAIVSELFNHPEIEVDTETTGLDPYTSKPVLLQIGTLNKAYVFDVRHDTEHSDIHMDLFKPIMVEPTVNKILQNAVFDMKVFKVNGGYYLKNVYDTMLAEQLINLGLMVRGAGLADIINKYLGLSMDKEPRGTFQDYNQTFEPYQLDYAAKDVSVLTLIKDLQRPALEEHGLLDVASLEFDFIKPMCEMELNGITIDAVKWRRMFKYIDEECTASRDDLLDMLSQSYGQNVMFGLPVININSNKQLLKALHNQGIDIPSTDNKVVSKFKKLPVIAQLMAYRKLNKLISTYGESLLEKINPVTGRLHTSFQQMVQTGRMSSRAPNIQNIPKQQRYRSCFVAKPGYKLVTADMSGAELRILGNLSEDPVFLECFNKGIDLHSRSASEIFGVPIEDVDHKMRTACKAISFGLCVDEDTELITNKGIIKIKDVNVEDSVAHDLGDDIIIDKKFMGEKDVYKIVTQFGYELVCTKDHTLKVIDCEGNYVDKKLSQLDLLNDQVCIKYGSKVFSELPYVFDKFSVEETTNYKHFDLPKVLSEDWASFFGLFVSEGCLLRVKKRKKYSSISFNFSKTASSEFIVKIDLLFGRLFGDRFCRVVTDTHVSFTINSVLIGEWLSSLFNYKDRLNSKTVHVPDCIKKGTKGIQTEFLRWIMEGDGTIKKNGAGIKLQYSSKSSQLVKDLQLMFLNFGILTSITTETRKKYPGELYYVLSVISNKSSRLFIDEIGFLTEYKNDKFTINVRYDAMSYKIMNQSDRLNKMILNIPSTLKSDRSYYDALYNCINYNNGNISNIYLKKLAKLDDFLSFMDNNNIVPLNIKSIETVGKRKVYDISVKEHQYFLADGFVVHNCYGMSKFGLAARLNIKEKEAEKLINNYFDVFKSVKNFLDKSAADGVRLGYTETVSGRKRFYKIPPFGHPDRSKIQKMVERQAKNAGIQGANADAIKSAMVKVVDRLEESGLDAKLLLTVHDELVCEVVEGQEQEVSKIVEQSIVDGFGDFFTKIPMETDALIGPSWLKHACENELDGGTECGCAEMIFVDGGKYGTELVCSSCGAIQE